MSTDWSRGVLKVPIVTAQNVTGPLPVKSVRANPNITKQVHFANFAGDYLVGMNEAEHPAGEECGTHTHRGAHEAFYILAGKGTIVVDDQPYSLVQGDSIVVPAGVSHNLVGEESEDGSRFKVLCLFVVAPGCEGDATPWVASDSVV